MADKFRVEYLEASENEHRFEIDLSRGQTLVLGSFKDMVFVQVEGGSWDWVVTSKGLMGDFQSEDWLARNGTVMSKADPIGFAEDWQVRDTDPFLFHAVLGPQHPQRCILPADYASEEARRLAESLVTRESAQEACKHLHFAEKCVHDVMLTGDYDLAKSSMF